MLRRTPRPRLADLLPRRRRGTVLIAVLVVVTVLSLAAYQYSDLMTAEYRASDYAHRHAQARALADSGLHYAAALLASPDAVASQLNGNPWNNPSAFQDVQVPGDEALSLPGRFTLIAPPDAEDFVQGGVRFGVTDEGGKININTVMSLDSSGQALHDMLMKLPNMTEDVASAIVDWVDPDGEPRTGGAENEYYSGLTPPYQTKNGPLESLEELLFVRGVTPDLLFGGDLNRNGIQDPGEVDESGGFSFGWSAYLTVWSREQNRDAQGNVYLNLNDQDLQTLYQSLQPLVGDDLAKFIILYRQNGASNSQGQQQGLGSTLGALLGGSSGSSKSGSGSSGSSGKSGSGSSGSGGSSSSVPTGSLADFQPDFTKKGGTNLTSIFDLVNAQVTGQTKDAQGKSTSVLYKSPLSDVIQQRDLLPKLFTVATISADPEIPARINVNTAPREVIAALPELSANDAERVAGLRPKLSSTDAPGEIYQTPTWLLTEANLTVDTLRKLEKYVTTRTQVYRVQSVGYFDGRGPACRVEAIIDVNGGRPRILAWRDLSELGRGWSPEPASDGP